MSTPPRVAHRAVRLVCEALEDRVNPVAAFALGGVGLGTGNLLTFDTATPGTVTTVAITGIAGTETLVGFDIRPVNGLLYALGMDATGTTGSLYTIATPTGVATVVGTAGGVVPASGTPVTGGTAGLATPPAAGGFGFDFNPTVDRIRVVDTGGQSFVVNPDTGVIQTNAPALNGAALTADGSAYTNNTPGAAATTLYAINAALGGALYTQNPTTSALTAVGTGLGLTAGTVVNGFDIPAGVSVATSGTLATGLGFAILTDGATTSLYSIDLTTGTATSLGAIDAGTTAVSGLAVTAGGAVSFQSAALTGNEDSAGVNVVLTRTGATAPQTVSISVTGGTVTPGVDLPAGPFPVFFLNGQTTATVNIPFLTDGLAEGMETAILTITSVSNGTIGAQNTTTLTIGDTVQRFAQVFGTGSSITAVAVMSSSSAALPIFPPYNLAAGVRVAIGDVNNDGFNDLVTVPTGTVPLVKVFNGIDGSEMVNFLAYPASFNHAASLAVGDVNNDGFDDIIIGTNDSLSAVLVFSGQNFALQGSFVAFGSFPIGVNVAVGDTDGDGQQDIIASTATGLAAIAVFDGLTFTQKQLFLPFGGFSGGATVAAGDLDGDNIDEIIVGTGSVVPAFGVFKGSVQQNVLLPFGTVTDGLNVAVNDANGDGQSDIVVGLATGLAVTAAYDGASLSLINNLLPFGSFVGGVFVS